MIWVTVKLYVVFLLCSWKCSKSMSEMFTAFYKRQEIIKRYLRPVFIMPLAKDTSFCGWGTIIALSKSFIRSWTQTLVLIMLSIKATKWLSKLHVNNVAQIKQCLSILVWTLKQLAGINTDLDINCTFSCKINVNYTARCFVTQSGYLTFHFRDYTSNCGALTLGISQLVCNRFVTVKLKRSFQSATNENEALEPPSDPSQRIWT